VNAAAKAFMPKETPQNGFVEKIAIYHHSVLPSHHTT
jgi:hypothetical protein